MGCMQGVVYKKSAKKKKMGVPGFWAQSSVPHHSALQPLDVRPVSLRMIGPTRSNGTSGCQATCQAVSLAEPLA